MTCTDLEPQSSNVTEIKTTNDIGTHITLDMESAHNSENTHKVCLVVGGFLSTADTNSPFRRAFVEEAGIDTATMDYSEVPLSKTLRTDEVRVEDVEAAIRALGELKSEIIIVAHSMGAAITLDTVLQLDGELRSKIKAIVMANGAGLIEDDGLKILARVAKAYKDGKESGKGFGEKALGKKRTIRSLASKAIRLTADAINAARNKSIREIERLADLGIPVINIVSQYDTVFPDELVHESVKNSPFYAQASMIGASHFTPSEEPQKLARAVKGMLD